MVGCVFWRMPRNTQLSPANSDGKVADTANSGGVADTVVDVGQAEQAEDGRGDFDANNNGELEDGRQQEDSRLKSPSFFQPQQHE